MSSSWGSRTGDWAPKSGMWAVFSAVLWGVLALPVHILSSIYLSVSRMKALWASIGMPPGYEPEPYNPEVGNAIHPEAVLLVECPREYVPLSRSGGVAFFTPATNREVIALYLSTKHKLENCPQHYDAARFVLERALRRKLEGSKAFAKLAADAEFNREVLSLAVLEGVFANAFPGVRFVSRMRVVRGKECPRLVEAKGARGCGAQCAGCGAKPSKGGKQLMACAACAGDAAVYYCSRTCATAAWPVHKAACASQQPVRAPAGVTVAVAVSGGGSAKGKSV